MAQQDVDRCQDDRSHQRQAWLSVAARLAKQQGSLEKSINCCNTSQGDAQPDQSHEVEYLTARLAARRRMLDDIRSGLRHADLWPQNLPVLASKIRECESDITSARALHRSEILRLQQEEPGLTAEAEQAANKVQHILSCPSSTAQKPQRIEPGCSGRNRPEGSRGPLPEVEQFDAYLQEHGPTGRWHPDDHAHFERVLRRNKGDYLLAVSDCSRDLLGYTPEDINNHAEWHSRYMDLLAGKKAAIVRWKEEKRAESQLAALRHQASAAEEVAELNRVKGDEARVLREIQQRTVKEWKEQQKAQQQQAADAERRRKEEAEQAVAARLLAQKEATRARLEAYQKEKRAKAEMEAGAAAAALAEASARKVGSCAGASRAQERAALMLQRKAALAEQQMKEKEERALRLEKAQAQIRAKIEAKVGPSAERVLQPTRAAQRRAEATAEEGGRDAGGSIFIRHLPSRARPSWLRGV